MKGGQTQSAIESARRRRSDRPSKSQLENNKVGGRSAGNAGELKLYSEDAPGLQIGPSTVLLLSLSYIAVVVIMHVIGKVRGSSQAV